MDVNRAQEIVDSPKEFVVQLNSREVWIDSVDAYSGVAKVHPENDPKVSKNVPITELQEQ